MGMVGNYVETPSSPLFSRGMIGLAVVVFTVVVFDALPVLDTLHPLNARPLGVSVDSVASPRVAGMPGS